MGVFLVNKSRKPLAVVIYQMIEHSIDKHEKTVFDDTTTCISPGKNVMDEKQKEVPFP